MMHWIPVILILPYLFLLLKIFRSLHNIKSYSATSDPVTFVSIIIACRNEQENLPALLKSIEVQDYPKELFEVIIVDDNSSDRTLEIAAGYTGTINIITINNKGKGKKQAIRSGVNISSGNLIITTDADCRMGNGWIRKIATFYDQHMPDMIICPVKLESGSGFFTGFQELEFLSLQGITAGTASSGEGTMCNGANLSFTRKTYQDNSYNLHDLIDSGDDIFLLHSLKKQSNPKILWLESHEAIVTTSPSSTLRKYLDQRKRWISKGMAYNDKYTILLAIVTLVAILLQVSTLIAGLINPLFWLVSLSIFILKSLPDYLILQNVSRRYDRRELMGWFVPAQLIYPFYVLGVVFYALIARKKQGH